MVHYRWHYPESALFASTRMADGMTEVAERVRGVGAAGVPGDRDRVRGAAPGRGRRVRAHPRGRRGAACEDPPTLLGDRPCAVDCIVLGGLRAHTYMDPDPKKVTAGYPRVVAFSDGSADGWDGAGELVPFPASTDFARFVLDEMTSTYQPYVLANRAAQQAGAKACRADIYGEDVSYLSRPYPEQSRQMILDKIAHALSDADRQRVTEWLDDSGLHCFLDNGG